VSVLESMGSSLSLAIHVSRTSRLARKMSLDNIQAAVSQDVRTIKNESPNSSETGMQPRLTDGGIVNVYDKEETGIGMRSFHPFLPVDAKDYTLIAVSLERRTASIGGA